MSNPRSVKVSFFDNAKDQYAEVHEMSWDDFARSLLTPQLVSGDKTGQPAYSPTEFLDGRRKGDNALVVHFGVVDVDDAPPDVMDRHIATIREHKLDAVIYQTWRTFEAFPKGLFRYRIVVPLSRPIDVESEWERWWPAWAALWGGEAGCVDVGVIRDKARIYFGPCLPAFTPAEAVHGGQLFEGEAADVEGLLNKASVITDVARIDNGTPIKYDRDVLRGLLRKLRRSSNPKKLALVGPLQAVINGERFAEDGEQHDVLTRLCWHLVEELKNANLSNLAELFVPSLQLMEAEGSIREWPDVEGKYLLSARSNQAAATAAASQRSFQRGDAAEVTQRALSDLGRLYGAVVSSEGSLWAPEGCVWRAVDRVTVSQLVQSYSGWPIGARGELMVGKGLTDAVNDFALGYNRDEAFFVGKAPGRAFANGFVRVTDRGLVLEPLTEDHRVRFAYDFEVNLEAAPPTRWLGFLEETYPGEPEKVELLQEFFGAALAGVAHKFERVLLLLGRGHDGKSQVLSVLEGLFQKEELCSVPPSEWGNGQCRADLFNKGLNCVRDLPMEAYVSDNGYFKPIISGESVSAKVVYRPVFCFAPRVAHAFSINGFPKTKDHTFGYHRRWLIIEHHRQQPRETATINIGTLILNAERAAVMAWALRGAVRLLNRGRYDIPEVVQEVSDAYADSDPVVQWLSESCSQGGKSTVRELYHSYRVWCQLSGHQPQSETGFVHGMKQRGYVVERVKGTRYFPLSAK